MKIIYVENVRVPSERAHAYQIVQTCAWLARFGHEVTLVNPARTMDDVFDYFHLPHGLFQHVKLPVWDALASAWIPKRYGYAFERASFVRALRRWIDSSPPLSGHPLLNEEGAGGRSGYDVWYTRDPAMVDALRATSAKRWVLELHDAPDADPSRWKRIKDQVAKFVVLTNGLKEKLIALGVPSDRIHVAPDGYDPEEFKTLRSRQDARAEMHLPSDAFVAMYTGGFFPWKGVDLVVTAWGKTDARAHLVLIGGPDKDRARLESLLDPAAKKRVHFFPMMERRKALSLLPAGDIGLLTTSPDFSIGRLYTSPLKQFEYLAAGLPILGSDVPSSHEILNDTVAQFYASTEEGFVTALGQVMRDRAWLTQAQTIAQIFVAPYTWEERTRGIVEGMGTGEYHESAVL